MHAQISICSGIYVHYTYYLIYDAVVKVMFSRNSIQTKVEVMLLVPTGGIDRSIKWRGKARLHLVYEHKMLVPLISQISMLQRDAA